MTQIDVPSETILVEMGEDGLSILETTMQMSSMDERCPGEMRYMLKTAMHDTIHISIYTLKYILYFAIRQKEDKIMNKQRNVTKKDQEEIDNFVEIMSGFDDGEHVYCAYHGKQKAIGNYAECEQCLIDDKNEQMARLEVEAEKIGYHPGNQEE